MAEYGSPPYQPYEFLDLSDNALSVAEKVNLSTIVQPSTVPLPGSGGVVWKTPRNISPEFEFGDVSAVFKSLSVASPSPTRPPVPVTTHPALSASSTPFVPSLNSHSIPIPLPTMGNGQGSAHPQTIHINNFTANLNYHGMQGIPSTHQNPLENQDSPVNSYPTPNGTPQPGFYPQQYVAPFSGQPHMPHPQPQQLYSDPGQAPIHPYHHPGVMFVTMPHHGHPYHGPQIVQQRPREDQHPAVVNGGITFGSTPVVSIRNGKRNSETEEQYSEERLQNHSYTPSPIPSTQFRGYTHAASPPAPTHLQVTPSPQPPAQQSAAPPAPPVAQPKPCPVEMPPVPTYVKSFPVKSEPPKIQSTPTPTQLIPQEKAQSEPVRHIKPVPTPTPQASTPQASPSLAKSPKAQSEPVKPAPTPEPVAQKTPVEPEASKAAPPVEVSPSPGPAAPVGSWASLFASKTTNSISDSASKPMARIPPFSATDRVDAQEPKEPNSAEKELGNFLNNYALKHVATALLPRGLTNRSNWCFVNAILQALLACPPFYNLMKNLPNSVLDLKTQKSKTPMLDSIVEFINEFSVLEQMNKNQKKDKNRKKEDIVTGIGLEPSYVYRMLLNLEEDTFKVVDGRQEDAEEFLTCLLNGLSDEMLAMMKLAAEEPVNEAPAIEASADEAPDDWQEVGAKGKSCVTRRVTNASHVQTPIQSLALGMCRSCVKSESGDNSATLQPFYTLQLDIQDQAIQSVTDALGQNFANEKLDGFICSKTKKEIDATRILSLEELPSILILHLKRFVYDGQTGGVQKIMKQIEFGVDLEISKSILSAECRASPKQRQYKLFGVVYHAGREATKGHYVTDIYHTGYATWLHCDDSIVQPTAEQLVVTPTASSTPYLLFYRRGDTMVGMEKKS